MSDRYSPKTIGFALVIVRFINSTSINLLTQERNKDGKYLIVNETRNRGWWLPGGGVDAGETLR